MSPYTKLASSHFMFVYLYTHSFIYMYVVSMYLVCIVLYCTCWVESWLWLSPITTVIPVFLFPVCLCFHISCICEQQTVRLVCVGSLPHEVLPYIYSNNFSAFQSLYVDLDWGQGGVSHCACMLYIFLSRWDSLYMIYICTVFILLPSLHELNSVKHT